MSSYSSKMPSPMNIPHSCIFRTSTNWKRSLNPSFLLLVTLEPWPVPKNESLILLTIWILGFFLKRCRIVFLENPLVAIFLTTTVGLYDRPMSKEYSFNLRRLFWSYAWMAIRGCRKNLWDEDLSFIRLLSFFELFQFYLSWRFEICIFVLMVIFTLESSLFWQLSLQEDIGCVIHWCSCPFIDYE